MYKSILTCKCSGCVKSEKDREKVNAPYRYESGRKQNIFHLTLYILLIPGVGAIFIGFSIWALVPLISFIIAYLVNSLLFCATCSYHHENVRFCGCFPKSVFPYKRYRGWEPLDNIIGWPLISALLFGPTVCVLALKNWHGLLIYLLFITAAALLHSDRSCPNCRQRTVCYMGKRIIKTRRKQGYIGSDM